jgi:hypothetical protein
MNRFVFASSLLALALLIPGAARAADPRMDGGPAAGRSPGVATTPRLTAEQRAIVAVQEEGRRQVESLVKSMAGLPDGPVLRALELKVEQLKRDEQVQCLRIRAQFALQRGDLAAAHEAEGLIDLILHPRPVTPVANTRSVPTREGGRP